MTNSELRVLLIDDEATIRAALGINLKSQSYTVAEASTGQEGIEKTKTFHPHLIILDLGLPDMDGIQVLRELRTWTTIPIVILTVKDDEGTKVRLLDAGADDYLTKPFGPSELLARVRVGLRHHGLAEATPVFESGDLKVDINQKQVSIAGNQVKLTKTEFELLSRLVRDQGKVISQTQLMKQIWGVTAEHETHYLRIYVKQLRKKIEKNPADPKHLLTEPGVGYRLV
tara:strand:- start:19779 stop:20462 length:684 start_codon:yes stop_codon:yes gene_type:complete